MYSPPRGVLLIDQVLVYICGILTVPKIEGNALDFETLKEMACYALGNI